MISTGPDKEDSSNTKLQGWKISFFPLWWREEASFRRSRLKETVSNCQMTPSVRRLQRLSGDFNFSLSSTAAPYKTQKEQQHTHPGFQPITPVELFLQQVQACVQLVALLSAQAVQRRVEGWGGCQAAAGNLSVLTAPSTLPPEAKDVGHA